MTMFSRDSDCRRRSPAFRQLLKNPGFNSDLSILGREILLSGSSYSVID
jgi:hypothetical protein